MGNEARISLIVDGASRAALGARSVGDALKNLGAAAVRAGADLAKAMNDVKPISFQQAADSAKKFDDTVTRLAVRANRDVGQLKQQFRDTGKEIGVLPDRVAQAARALTKMTGSADAADAIRDLGVEANDTDRSIEEMGELGATLFNKLGVPASRVGETFAKLRTIAKDFQTAGGHIALEDTLVRLGPLLARFEGGVVRAAATVAVLGKGKSKDVAEETTGSVLGTLQGLDPLLLTKKMRELTGDRDYKPYKRDQQGRTVLKQEVPGQLQKYLRTLPRSAVYSLFGRSMQGVAAAETFLDADLAEVTTEEDKIQLEDDVRAVEEQKARAQMQHGKGDPQGRLSSMSLRGLVSGPGRGSRFAATAAGRRAQTDAEREDVNLSVGDVVQAQRDKRNAAYAGHRGLQATIDTAKSYIGMPGLDIVEAATIEARDRYQRSAPGGSSGSTQPVTVNLTPASTKAIADALRAAPPVVHTGKSPAAQAVEDSKAKGRAAANY